MVKRNCRDELLEFRGGPAEIRHRYGTRSQAGEELAEKPSGAGTPPDMWRLERSLAEEVRTNPAP
jgi:hypothetical protein